MKRVKKKAGARVAPKPNQKLVRGFARALKKRGVTVDARGRARKHGRVITADRLRRAVAAVKRALVPAPKKKTAVAAKRPISKAKVSPKKTPSRAVAKKPSRAVAPPTKTKTKKPVHKPAKKIATVATKKPSRAITKVPTRAVSKAKPPTKKAAAARRPSAAAQRAAAQLSRARTERARLAAQLRAQAERQQKLEAEQRRLRREASAMKKQLAALTQQEKRAERVVESIAAEEETVVPPEAPTDEERLFAEQRAEQAERERLKPRPATPFEILLKPYVDAGKMPTADELRELQLAAAAMGAPPSLEASDADFAIASAYENISSKEQRAWARALNADGRPRLSEAARQIIREHAIERAIKNRSPKALVDMRASPLFNDDAAVREMMRTLGPLEDRISISYDDARRLIVEHLKTKEKWGAYRDEINKYLATLRPTSDQIQEAIKFAKTDIERQKILDHLIPELARKYGLDERELWTMAKSPSSVAVVV